MPSTPRQSAFWALEAGLAAGAATLAPDILDLLPIGLQIDDAQHRTIYVNDSFTRMFGYAPADIAENDDWFQRVYPDPAYRETVFKEWHHIIERLSVAADRVDIEPQERLLHCKNGEQKIIEFHVGRIKDYYIYLYVDVTARHAMAAELWRLAHTDPLTGAANRRHFFEMGTALLSPRSGPVAVLIFDLDHFKTVNDAHGHAAGDQVLVQVVARCRAVLAHEHLLARLGGEEFGILLPGCDEAAALKIAEQLRVAVAQSPIAAGSVKLGVTISLGGCCAGLEGADLDTLIGRADRALYAAKRAGRNVARLAVP